MLARIEETTMRIMRVRVMGVLVKPLAIMLGGARMEGVVAQMFII